MRALTVACAALLLVPTLTWAAEGDLPLRTSGFYLGLGAGYSSIELKNDPVNVSGGDFGYKAFGGYRFPRAFLPWGINVGLEAAWVNLGEATENVQGAELALAVDGFAGYFVGFIPITRHFELVGKAGVYAWDGDLALGGSTQEKDSGTDFALSIGLAYQGGGQLGFLLEVEGYDMVDGALLASASVTYQFK